MNNVLNYSSTQDRKGVLGKLEGVCADTIKSTRNGRRYSETLWEKVFKDPIIKEYFDCGGIFGELGHPADREETLAEYNIKMGIISEYAPTLLTDENEIKEKILSIINDKIELTKTNRGLIMKQIAPELKGKADMSIANKVLSKLLV